MICLGSEVFHLARNDDLDRASDMPTYDYVHLLRHSGCEPQQLCLYLRGVAVLLEAARALYLASIATILEETTRMC